MSEWTCFYCSGHGWIWDGQPDDGRMTGRMTCPRCKGSRVVDSEAVLTEIERILGVGK